MKKFSALFILALLSLSAFAQEMTCQDKLLPSNRFSGVHLVSREEWNDGKDLFDAEGAKNAWNFLINSKLLCKRNEVVIKVQPVCTTIMADLPQSQTCFLYTNLGYFVISRDNSKNTSFIFSKDRRFSDPTDSEEL